MIETNKNYIRQNIAIKRLDGRTYKDFRKLSVETNLIEKAEGSALVTLGETKVLVGVKMDLGTPFPDSGDVGILMTNAERSPIASPEFESGPPNDDTIELARVVDRGIRESGCIDFHKLCIKEGEKVWMVFVDISILNNDGNLFDAAAAGAISALLTAKIPKLNDNGTVNRSEYDGALVVTDLPIMVTTALINGVMVVDPTADEEEVIEGRVHVTSIEAGICAMQKSGSCEFTEEQIMTAIDNSIAMGKELRKQLKKK
ncbi:MAG: exosome complex protein Rrp42 [DPANN group archaeon]|nr:exosome complex protein Rrp42 [DPANN group archaeon]